MKNQYKIYGLKVIGSDDIRYVGYTKRKLIERLKSHFDDAKKGFTYRKCNWIRSNNYNIEIVLLEDELTYEEALVAEVKWISKYDNLTNMTKGGDSNPMESEIVIKKHRESMKKLDKSRTSRFGSDNWMTSDEGKKWISNEAKRRWRDGVYNGLMDDRKKIIDRDILYKLYITENKTLKEIASILNTTYRSVVRNLGNYKIKKYKYK